MERRDFLKQSALTAAAAAATKLSACHYARQSHRTPALWAKQASICRSIGFGGIVVHE